MKEAITFLRTQTERTGDSTRPFQFNRTQEHEERIIGHCARVQREFFDSGLYHKETHPAELID